MAGSAPTISAVICTRNRGAQVVETVESVLNNTHQNFEALVIDQSADTDTKDAIQKYLSDPRLRYIRTDTVGLGWSRNIGLEEARGQIVAYVDDDATVFADWLEKIERVFQSDSRIGLVYCRVDPAPFQAEQGYIPELILQRDFVLTKVSDCYEVELGIGAGMAVCKAILQEIGSFDVYLGAGAYFSSGEDRDIAIRLLLKGYCVYFSSEIKVIHKGFRTYEEGREHTKRDYYGLGATYIKPVKSGHFSAVVLFFSKPLITSLVKPYLRALRLKRPQGFKKPYYFLQGVLKGLVTPVDRKSIVYARKQS